MWAGGMFPFSQECTERKSDENIVKVGNVHWKTIYIIYRRNQIFKDHSNGLGDGVLAGGV